MKNFFNVKCTDLTHEGLGVVRVDEKPYFVFNLLPTEKAEVEVIKANSNFGYAKIIKRSESSPERIKPECDLFGKCGGCDLCHMSYEAETAFKLKMVNDTYKKIGHLDYKITNILKADNTMHYRNKVQIPFQDANGKAICGFYQKQSHNIIEVRKCLLQTDLTTDIAIFVKNIMNEYKIKAYNENTHKGSLRHLLVRKNSNDEYMIALIVCEYNESDIEILTKKIINKFSAVKSIILNINKNENNIILGDKYKVLYGNDYLIEDILGLKFKMSHKAFFQINHKQTEKLYTKVLELSEITKNDVALDCYCGVGTISLLLAQKAKKVYGIEIVEEAINDAKENAKINNIDNAQFIVGTVEDKINDIKEKIDVLVVDPPRKGLDEKVTEAIKKSKIEKVVYVSCNVSTMARDISILKDQYDISEALCVDLFPRTCNVETIALLSRKK